MNKKKWKLAVFLSGLCSLPAFAITNDGSRPKAENYASYSLYLQALFDYQRAQELGARTTHATANPKRPINTDRLAEESLDDVMARGMGTAGYVDPSAKPRSTFKTFALSQLPAQDMGGTSVDDALGNFDSHVMQQKPETTARLRADNPLALFEDEEISVLQDINHARWTIQSAQAANSFSGHISLPEGEADASISAQKGQEGELELSLSSKVRSNIYIVDRDGFAGAHHPHAGVVAIQPLSLAFNNLHAHITTPRHNNGNRYIAISASSPNPIIIDFSGSRFGVAHAATGTGGTIALQNPAEGQISYFAKLGNNALLSIAPNMLMDITVDKPDGLRKPFVRINGKIGEISLGDIGLLSNGSSNNELTGLHIGKLRLSGIDLINAALYSKDESFILDLGTGLRDMRIAMERFALGSEGGVIGDIDAHISAPPHTRITISAH